MKIVTFFFSGTGNSWWVAQNSTRVFRELGHDAACCSIENNMGDDYVNRIDEFDMIGFAYPIYGADFPPIFKRFINNLIGKRAGSAVKTCFTLCTIGYVNALGPIVAGNILRKAHFKVKGSLNIKLSNNVSAPHCKTRVFNGPELHNRKEKALLQLKRWATKLTNNKKMITGIGPYLLPGYIIRMISNRKIKKSHEKWSVDVSRCSHCRVCINMCPTNSILFINDKFEFKNTCTVCFRCYNTCPNNAIVHSGNYADPDHYRRYKGPEKDWYKQMVAAYR